MSEYRTISSDYRVIQIDNGTIMKDISVYHSLYMLALKEMVRKFNEAHLESYLDDEDAVKVLGYPIKDRIQSITMQLLTRCDAEGRPYIRITVSSIPGTLRITEKVRNFLDDYLSAQFTDGWGESIFFPAYIAELENNEFLAIE